MKLPKLGDMLYFNTGANPYVNFFLYNKGMGSRAIGSKEIFNINHWLNMTLINERICKHI